MPGWLRSIGSGLFTSMLLNGTSIAWINQHERKRRQGEGDDRSRAVYTGSRQRGAGTKGRREVDAHPRQSYRTSFGADCRLEERPDRPPSAVERCDQRSLARSINAFTGTSLMSGFVGAGVSRLLTYRSPSRPWRLYSGTQRSFH